VELLELIKWLILNYINSEMALPPVLAMFSREEMISSKPFTLPAKRGRRNSIEAMMKRGELHKQAAAMQAAGMSVEKSHETVAKNNAAAFDTVKGADQSYKKDTENINREILKIMRKVDQATADAISLDSFIASFKRLLN
jgi:hypothetical protein